MADTDPTLSARFWAKIDKTGSCWEWRGAVSGNGYPCFKINGRQHNAMRAAWYVVYGEMPPRHIHVCHHCDNRRCVRPDHLFLGTAKDNAQDMIAKGRKAYPTRTQTHCKNGHPLVPGNLRPRSTGWRLCLICSRAYIKKWRLERVAKGLPYRYTDREQSRLSAGLTPGLYQRLPSPRAI